MEYYKAERVNEHLTCIRSLAGELMYLIEGDKESILIDTCAGIKGLRKLVEELTDKPVTVLISHGHVDHAMGASEFEKVYLNIKDIGVYRSQCSLEERKGYVGACLGEAAKNISDTDYLICDPGQNFLPLEDGMVFDLEPFHIECYELAGHTPGTMIFLIREMGILISGDACNTATFVFDGNSLPLSVYREKLIENRNRLQGKYDRVFLMHHVMEADCDIMDNVIDVCEEALAGRTDDIPYSFMGMQAFIAKKCNERFERSDGKMGNIIYSKENL